MMDRKHLTIMAIGAHIGDMELTCGKLLASHALLGDKIITVALTAGERGAPAQFKVEDFRKRQIQSAEKFARMLNGESIVLRYADGELPDNDDVRFEVCDLMRKYRPDVVITHWFKSMHKDHRTTCRVVNDAVFFASLKTFKRSEPSCCPKGPLYAQNWEDSEDFKPYLYFDVGSGYALWEKAVSNLWLAGHSTFGYLKYYDALSRVNGIRVGKERAETYAVDPVNVKAVYNSLDDFV